MMVPGLAVDGPALAVVYRLSLQRKRRCRNGRPARNSSPSTRFRVQSARSRRRKPNTVLTTPISILSRQVHHPYIERSGPLENCQQLPIRRRNRPCPKATRLVPHNSRLTEFINVQNHSSPCGSARNIPATTIRRPIERLQTRSPRDSDLSRWPSVESAGANSAGSSNFPIEDRNLFAIRR